MGLDGIVGPLNIDSILLANQFGLNWMYVAVAADIIQIIRPNDKILFCIYNIK